MTEDLPKHPLQKIQDEMWEITKKIVFFVAIPFGILMAAAAATYIWYGGDLSWWVVLGLGIFPTAAVIHAGSRLLP